MPRLLPLLAAPLPWSCSPGAAAPVAGDPAAIELFGWPAFTQRPWDHARAGGRSSVQTPQLLVNGGPIVAAPRL